MAEYTVKIEGACNFYNVRRRFSLGLYADGDVVTIQFRRCFIFPSAINALLLIVECLQNSGCNVVFEGSADTLDYISRLDVFTELGIERAEKFSRHRTNNRFLCATRIGEKSYSEAFQNIMDLIATNVKTDLQSFSAIEWAIGEIIDNVVNHSQSHGFVCGQYYPKKSELELSVGDGGIGIRNAFLKNVDLIEEEVASGFLNETATLGHARALELALRKGVTSGSGQGNGLFGCRELIRQNKGNMQIWSGTAARYFGPTAGNSTQTLDFQGTVVNLCFDTKNSISMKNTALFHEPFSTYLHSYEERDNFILVREMCERTQFRKDAAPLRAKLLNLSEHIESKLIIDFSGIESAGSSFLDELVSKLVEELGKDRFRKNFGITGLNDTILGLLNHVIVQRNKVTIEELVS